MRRFPGNDLLIAHDPRGGTLTLSAKDRSMHMYVVGATGVGKSKFLEHIVRQDIRNWRKSGCGLLLLDPHGAVYDGVMQWLTRMSFVYNRPIIPIDLRRDDWVVAYNLLRKRKAAASVITANMVDALAYVWGAGSTDATPLFARTATMVFRALYEHRLTLSDALSILEHANQDFRAALARGLEDEVTRESLNRMNTLRTADYNAEVGSTLNRFQRLLGNNLLKATFGQPDVSLDLGAALEEGHILLVSLATEGGTVSPEDADIVPKDISNEVLSRLTLNPAEKELVKRVYRGLRGNGFEIHVWRDVDHLCIGWKNFRAPAAGQAQLLGYRREGGYRHHDPTESLADNGEFIVDSRGEKGFAEDYIRPNTTYYYTFMIRERNKYYG